MGVPGGHATVLEIAGNAGLVNKDVEELNKILQSFSTASATAQ